jgi:tetratricopeptide (TPR) repeat protein
MGPTLRYRECMAASRWSRTALALALLFASLPLAGKLFLGSWGFEDATLLAVLCFLVAAYLHIRGRRSAHPAPDDAALLDQAIQLAASGQPAEAIALLTEAIRLSPRLWQAFQYRGELYLQRGSADAALQDFDRAIGLAPNESHIHVLRGYAQALLATESKNSS